MHIKVSSETSPQSLSWRGQWLGWLGLAILVGFTWLNYSYYLMVSWPWIAVWQVGFLLLGVWGIWMLRQFQLPFKPLGYGLDWAVGLIAVALLLSAIFSPFPRLALWNVSLVVGYGVLLYVLRNWLGKGGLTLTRLWVGVCLVGLVASIISIIWWYPTWVEDAARNGFPMGNPNFVAGYVMLVFPLTISLALSSKGWQRIAGFAASFLLGMVLYSTSSRGGFLGILILTLVSALFFVLRGRGKQRWQRLIGCMAILAVISLILLSHPRVQESFQIALSTNNSSAIPAKIDYSTQERLLMFHSCVNILKAKPLFGVGAGNMARVYNLYRPIDVGMSAAQLQQLHSTPLQILGELGLVGFTAFLFSIGCLIRLWWKLYRRLSKPNECYLLYGIGGGLLAYAVSSLTDYQLENISLSSTLALLIVLLIGLVNSGSTQLNELAPPTPQGREIDSEATTDLPKSSIPPSPLIKGGAGGAIYYGIEGREDNLPGNLGDNFINPKEIPLSRRRWLSLGGITVLVLILLLWLPVAWGMKLASDADGTFKGGNIEKAYEQLSDAANLVPWDPVYSLLAGFRLLDVQEGIKDTQLKKELSDLSLQQFERAIKLTPNDAYFNRNLGLLYLEQGKSKQAEVYLNRAVQLLPRIGFFTYYLLGQAYLQQQEIEKAKTSFAIQGLIRPEFLTFNLWNQPPLAPLKDSVVEKTLSYFEVLLKELPSNALNYNRVYENKVLLQWWHQKSIENLDLNKLRPISQALIVAETSPKEALKIINNNVSIDSENEALLLLRAWIDPQVYLNSYFEKFSISAEEKDGIKKHISSHRNLREWLSSLTQKSEESEGFRNALPLSYRNSKASQVARILVVKDAQANLLMQTLGLFNSYPVVLPSLDQLINRSKMEQIDLKYFDTSSFQLR